MTHLDLLKGLRRVSPAFTLDSRQDDVWYPGQSMARKSRGLYLDVGSFGCEKFICGITEGEQEPYDIVNEVGRTLIRGWREVLRKVVRDGWASKASVEAIFEVSLGDPRDPQPLYRRCGCRYERLVECKHGEGRTAETQVDMDYDEFLGRNL